jgi:hypothetical protein
MFYFLSFDVKEKIKSSSYKKVEIKSTFYMFCYCIGNFKLFFFVKYPSKKLTSLYIIVLLNTIVNHNKHLVCVWYQSGFAEIMVSYRAFATIISNLHLVLV